jgi:hypothetical protein
MSLGKIFFFMGGNVPPWGKYCIVWGKILSKTIDSGGYLVK